MSKFPDYKTVSVDKLIPYIRNSRTHSDEQVAQIAASIKEFGFTNPVLIDGEGGIIAGHGRVMAARKLGIDEVPCITLDYLTDAQKRAYIIADNKLALNAGWDDEMLRIEFAELEELGFDLELTGFSLDEIDELQVEEIEDGLTDEDAVPEVVDEPVSVLGDVWLLGKHRLMCGDSTSIDAVDKLMAGQKADMVFTDPPYDLEDDIYGESLLSASENAHIFVMHDDRGIVNYLRKSAFDFKRFFVLNFGFSSPRGNDPYLQHILLSHEQHGKPITHKNLRDGFSSIIKMEYRHRLKDDKTGHKHQKPISTISLFIEHYTDKDFTVLDIFGGSGSTLIACEKTGRHARLMELDPKYCDVIIKRWQDFTGQKAIHEETGKAYAELANGQPTTQTDRKNASRSFSAVQLRHPTRGVGKALKDSLYAPASLCEVVV